MISRLIAKRIQVPARALSTLSEAKEIVNLTIDGKPVSVSKGTKLIEAIKMTQSSVPTMCYHPDLPNSGGICRVCLVESANSPGKPIISCKTPVAEGMDILTQGIQSKEYRQANLAMMLAKHPNSCLSCPANTKCKAQDLSSEANCEKYGIAEVTEPNHSKKVDNSSPIWRDQDKCINCDICVQACNMQGIYALGSYNESTHTVRSMGLLNESECINCGQCINRCPVGAITEESEIRPVIEAVKNPKKTVVFQMAPSVRVALAEEFGCKPGERILKNEVVTALKKLGPNVVVMDTDFSADLTIIEEGNELLERLYRKIGRAHV